MTFPPPALRWLVAVLVALTLSVLSLRRYLPPLPNPLTLDLIVDKHDPGKSEPLIASGRTQAGDFLFVRFLDDAMLSLGYETWGEPGQFSKPIPLPPDRRIRLEIEMPGLSQIRGVFAPANDRLRVIANGTELFNAAVVYNVRAPSEIYFAANPIGGTACDAELHGRLLLPDGRELRGVPSSLYPLRERLIGWVTISRWQAVTAILAGIATFVVWGRLRWREVLAAVMVVRRKGQALGEHRFGGQLLRRAWRHRWFLATVAACTFSFTWMVTYGTFELLYAEPFGNFYEHQAASLLQGRLDVPSEAISGEAFIVNGRRYGYFGITPALLRLPFVIFGIHFGELSRSLMVLYFVATLAGCYGLLRTVYRLFGRGDDVPSAWATLCLVGGAGAGSTIYFLGSRAYIYHEAILCGVAFAVLGCWFALRHYAAPEKRAWTAALACGVFSVHARPPTGLFALTFLGAMALVTVMQRRGEQSLIVRRQLLIGALCGFGVVSFNLLSYLKFNTFEGCPLRYNVQYDAARLARIDGKQFHLVNLPLAIDSYLVRANFRLEAGFPYFLIGSNDPGRPWPRSKIDYHDNTLGIPYAMPGLFALATLGSMAAFMTFRSRRPLIAGAWLAGVPMSLAMFTAIAITQRYTADFCPFLLVCGALGVAGIEQSGPWPRMLLRTTVAAGTVCAVLITFAITVHYQGADVWGVPEEIRAKYAMMRHGVDTVVNAFRR